MKVLLIDDDPAFVLGATELLQRAGFEVEVAVDGSEGVLAARAGTANVVILDFRMPGFRGDTTASVLRNIAPDVKILGVSALPEADTGWADAFLSKDQVFDKLVPLVRDLASDSKESKD